MKFYFVSDVMQMLELSKSKSYKIIHQLNAELEKQGIMTVHGRVDQRYFCKRFCYGQEPSTQTEACI